MIPDLVTVRRQISYFGKVRAAKPAEDATSQSDLTARPHQKHFWIRCIVFIITQRTSRRTHHAADTKLNIFQSVAKIEAKTYNIPKKEISNFTKTNNGHQEQQTRTTYCEPMLSCTKRLISTGKNTKQCSWRMECNTNRKTGRCPRDTVMYVFNGIEIAPYENHFISQKNYVKVKPWYYSIPEQQQEDDKAYRVSPQELYSDILGVEMLESVDFDKWTFGPKRSLKTTTKLIQNKIPLKNITPQDGQIRNVTKKETM